MIPRYEHYPEMIRRGGDDEVSATARSRPRIAPIAVDCLIKKDESLIVTLNRPMNDPRALVGRFLWGASCKKPSDTFSLFTPPYPHEERVRALGAPQVVEDAGEVLQDEGEIRTSWC
jgi:hypothetical protein